MDRDEVAARLRSISRLSKIPVLIIDDYGEIVFSPTHRWLDSMLFAHINETSNRDEEALRCIVVTHPRDRNIRTFDGSGLIERAIPVVPEIATGTQQLAAAFGCVGPDALQRFCGGNAHLLRAGGRTPNERRGNVQSTAAQWLPKWISQLDVWHQSRLAEIIRRTRPPAWRRDDADPVLAPLVVPRQVDHELRCQMLESINPSDLQALLVGQPWPYGNMKAAADRFRARCGSEPRPLWIDNYLSAVQGSQWNQLVDFLVTVLDSQDDMSQFCILSRNWVNGREVKPSQIHDGLRAGGFPHRLDSRLCWKTYGSRASGRLHGRQLILRSRTEIFALPPATDVVGLVTRGNEGDAVVDIDNGVESMNAWKRGRTVFGNS